MKNKKQISRPAQAIIASILLLASIPAESHGLFILDLGLIFLGSFIFGHIFHEIKQERAEK